MSFDLHDLRATIIPKSDQLNSEQLLSGSITVTVTSVTVHDTAEQPVSIHYEGEDGRPFKPCKTMRKVLILAWGQDGSTWAGKSMTLYNDPTVTFGREKVGGIRISHLSDIARDIAVSLTATKGKKTLHTIKALQPVRAVPASVGFNLQASLKEVRLGIESGDSSGAAEYVSGLAESSQKAILDALNDAEYGSIIAAWPPQEAAA
jgi:hypothetical protein